MYFSVSMQVICGMFVLPWDIYMSVCPIYFDYTSNLHNGIYSDINANS